jgi:putative spermidine/putrescine transport system ATP-binding protein
MQDGSVISAQMASSLARGFTPGTTVSVGVEPTGVLVVKGDAA